MTPEPLLRACDEATLWTDGHAVPPDVDAAYQRALQVRALRIARGERPAGYKIGFTNRTIWARYGVFAPIWGTVWNTTLARCDGQGTVDLAGTCQPRIEPEVVFGIAAAPPADATLEDLFACIGWAAPGFEVVQSHCPGWKFSASETVMDGGLHARLVVGRPTPVRDIAPTGAALEACFAATRATLHLDGRQQDEGSGGNVLDGPLHALRHFVDELRRCPGAPALQAGDVVTTGTWTDAWPMVPGQAWRATFDGPFRASLELATR